MVSLRQKAEAQSPLGPGTLSNWRKVHGARGSGISQTRHRAVRPGQANPTQAGGTKHTSCDNHTLAPSTITPNRAV